MNHNKKSARTDQNKTTAGGSSKTAGKHDEKSDEKTLSKAVHKIEDRVHELTEDVKEKAHHLTHSDDSKKEKEHKKTNNKSKTSSKISNVDKKDSDEDKDENKSNPPLPPSSPAEPSPGPKVNEASSSSSSKPTNSEPRSKTMGPLSGGDSKPLSQKKKDNASGIADDKQKANPSKPPGDHVSNEKSTSLLTNSNSKQTIQKPTNVSNGISQSNQSSTKDYKNDKVHILFNGVDTVDDLLERIDDTVEKTKIIIDNGKDKNIPNIKEEEEEHPTSSSTTTDNNEKIANAKDQQKEPLRIIYSDIHQLKDLLTKTNDQPGHRKVILEGVPKQMNVISFKKADNNPSTKAIVSNTNEKVVEQSTSSKDPSSSELDIIHFNIENIRSVDDLLDRLDDAVQNVAVELDVESERETASGSSKPNENENTQNKVEAEKKRRLAKRDRAAAMKFQKQTPEIEPANKATTTNF